MREKLVKIADLATTYARKRGKPHYFRERCGDLEVEVRNESESEADAVGCKTLTVRYVRIWHQGSLALSATKDLGGLDEYSGYSKIEREYFPEEPWEFQHVSGDRLDVIESLLKQAHEGLDP